MSVKDLSPEKAAALQSERDTTVISNDKYDSNYQHISYSGADIKAIINIPNDFTNREGESVEPTIAVLADISSLSYSIYREKYPVRSLGYGYSKSFTRGPRTISGTIVFTMFDKNVLSEALDLISAKGDTTQDVSTVLIDQLPRFDITMSFSNEYGKVSNMSIYGVELISEGATFSIENMLTENVVSYVAQDITPMQKGNENAYVVGSSREKTATDTMAEGIKNREAKKQSEFTDIDSVPPFTPIGSL